MKIDIKANYIHLSSDLVLTKWNEGDDILTYSGSKHVYVHTEDEIKLYREITEAEHFKLEAEREEKEMAE